MPIRFDPGGVAPVTATGIGVTALTTWALLSGLANATALAAETAAAGGFYSVSTAAGSTYADPNAVRANNSITYHSPSFSGISAAVMYSFGAENTGTTNRSAGKMSSMKLAYASGPLSAAVGTQTTKGSVDERAKWNTTFLAASYNLGMAKVSAGYKTDKLTEASGLKVDTIKTTILGVAAPVGAVTLKASLVNRKDSAKMGNQFALGAVYDLSKRTSVYATYAALKNETGLGNTVGSALVTNFTGVNSKGFETGIKHSF